MVPVLGVPLACVDYDQAREAVCLLARQARPAAVSACNTHLVSVARHDAGFGLVLRSFDLIFPDSTVLKWTMNGRGARLSDRVYGPYFMRHMLEKCGKPWKHFFFGGSQECLDDLEKAARALNPDIEIVGKCSPPFRAWSEEDEEDFAKQIRESGADFIWVALGGERQESWIAKNRHRFQRGVFLAVGDAFRLLAGHGKFAPAWMQKAGLNWLHRLMQEPTRLWKRYFHHNSLYLLQLLSESVEDKRFSAPPPAGKLRIAFLGCRGVPARYAGFETVVQELGSRLASRGHEVMVYNRSPYYREKPPEFLGMDLVYLPTIMQRSLETIVHTMLCTLRALIQPHDVVYVCAVGNACFAGILRLTGKKIVINVDGIDFKRSKWSGFARWWLYQSEKWAIRFSDRVIADNEQVVNHYLDLHDFRPQHLSYGAERSSVEADFTTAELKKFSLKPNGYLLYVGRLSPENEADLLLRAYAETSRALPLVLVGPSGYENSYERKLRSLAVDGVIFAGAVYGAGYEELSKNARCFVLPAAIEATRLVLLDQMGFGKAVIFRDSAATREVIGDAGIPFDGPSREEDLAKKIELVFADSQLCAERGQSARFRAETLFGWNKIVDAYERVFFEIVGGAAAASAVTKITREKEDGRLA